VTRLLATDEDMDVIGTRCPTAARWGFRPVPTFIVGDVMRVPGAQNQPAALEKGSAELRNEG